jgi:poly(3-hydroxybutyrate) depolymerase
MDLAPIDPPVASGCIDDVSAGDHTYTCDGIPFLTMVDEQCTTHACGLIMDVHGATMTGAVMRMNNRLHELAPPKGYIAVAPTEPGGAWDFANQMPILAGFVDQMIAAFHPNTRRIHVTGFSMGSGATFWFLCNRPELIASAGPVTGSSASQVTVASTGMPCIESLDEDWLPRVPILFMSGTLDSALTAEAAQARTDGIVSRLGLTGGDEIEGDASYRRRRWTGADGMVFDFLTHDYSGVVAGHCIPGPTPDLIYGCTSRGVALDWGQTVLDFFIEHPKP